MTQSIENDLGIQLLQKQFNHQSFHLKIETVNQQEDLIKFSRPNCVQVDYPLTYLGTSLWPSCLTPTHAEHLDPLIRGSF